MTNERWTTIIALYSGYVLDVSGKLFNFAKTTTQH